MTQDEIMKMAKQAGFHIYNNCADGIVPDLEAFAKLVADVATAKEREACAKVAENGCNYPCADEIAAAIRARGEAT